MKVVGRGHFVQPTSDGCVDDCDTKHPEPGACPKRNEPDANVWADDIDDPVGRQRSDAEDDQERNDVVFLRVEFAGPFVETRFPFWDCEKSRTEGRADEVAEGGTARNTGAGQGEGTGDSPDCPTEDGEVHGPWQRERLQAAER